MHDRRRQDVGTDMPFAPLCEVRRRGLRQEELQRVAILERLAQPVRQLSGLAQRRGSLLPGKGTSIKNPRDARFFTVLSYWYIRGHFWSKRYRLGLFRYMPTICLFSILGLTKPYRGEINLHIHYTGLATYAELFNVARIITCPL